MSATIKDISFVDVIFNIKTTNKVTATEGRITRAGLMERSQKFVRYPTVNPAIIEIQDFITYLRNLDSDQIREGKAEATEAIRIENAAPKVP